MGKISKKILKWREKQPEQGIMSTEKFEEIKRKAAAGGAISPSAVAGASYWKTVKAKFKERRKKKE